MVNMKKWGAGIVCLLVGLVWFLPGKVAVPSDRAPYSFGKLTSEALTGEDPGSAVVTPVWGFCLSREVS